MIAKEGLMFVSGFGGVCVDIFFVEVMKLDLNVE